MYLAATNAQKLTKFARDLADSSHMMMKSAKAFFFDIL